MIGFYEPYWDQPDGLEHFGIKGMKWGIRRYQNADGTLTEVGKKRLRNKETVSIGWNPIMKPLLNKALSVSERMAGANKTKIKDIKKDRTLTDAQKFAKRMVNVPGFEMEEIVAFQNADSIIANMKRQNKNYKTIIPDNAKKLIKQSPWKEIANEVADRNNIDISTPEGEAMMGYVMLYWPNR